MSDSRPDDVLAQLWRDRSVHAERGCLAGVSSRHPSDTCGQPVDVICTGPMVATHWPGWCSRHAPACKNHRHVLVAAPAIGPTEIGGGAR